jgi:hypothetical protein
MKIRTTKLALVVSLTCRPLLLPLLVLDYFANVDRSFSLMALLAFHTIQSRRRIKYSRATTTTTRIAPTVIIPSNAFSKLA